MSIELTGWAHQEGSNEGRATFETAGNAYSVWLSSLEKAQIVEQILNNVFEEGRAKGRQEVLNILRSAVESLKLGSSIN